MILSDTAIRRPVLTLVVLIVLMLFGTLATRNMGIDIVPNVVVPYVSVIVVYPGASPEEIETSVARPIEDAAVQVDGLKHMTTTCANNFCQVLLEFNLNVDQNVAADDIRAKIAAIEGDLPSGAEKPQVQKYDVNAIPVVTLALTGEQSVDELYEYADDRLSGRLSTVAGVASVELIGGEEREVVVTVDRAKLAACGLTLAQVVRSARATSRFHQDSSRTMRASSPSCSTPRRAASRTSGGSRSEPCAARGSTCATSRRLRSARSARSRSPRSTDVPPS